MGALSLLLVFADGFPQVNVLLDIYQLVLFLESLECVELLLLIPESILDLLDEVNYLRVTLRESLNMHSIVKELLLDLVLLLQGHFNPLLLVYGVLSVTEDQLTEASDLVHLVQAQSIE